MRSSATRDYSSHVRKHDSRLVRVVLLVAGTLCVLLAIAGIVLPVLPTTPFLLLAAACYARASTRFYNALLNNRLFGPTVLEWQQHRSIPRRTKLFAIVLMSATLGASIVFAVDDNRIRAALAVLGVALAIYMYRIPSRDASGSPSDGQ
jgi:uncharacterized protein